MKEFQKQLSSNTIQSLGKCEDNNIKIGNESIPKATKFKHYRYACRKHTEMHVECTTSQKAVFQSWYIKKTQDTCNTCTTF